MMINKAGQEHGGTGVLLFYRGWSGKVSLIIWPLNCSLNAIRALLSEEGLSGQGNNMSKGMRGDCGQRSNEALCAGGKGKSDRRGLGVGAGCIRKGLGGHWRGL